MSLRYYPCVKRDIKYGQPLNCSDIDIEEALETISSKYDLELVVWSSEHTNDLEINYDNFINLIENFPYKKDFSKHVDFLEDLYDQVKDNKNLKENDYIRIDHF